jgi:hypothetical protein
MAIVKLSEIPNVPTQVANMTMNPQYAGDQVGGQAKADIARGYEGQMQNVQASGAMGRAVGAFGNDMTSFGGNLTSGALYFAKGKKTAELKDAEVTGMQPFYENKLKIENEYYDRVNNPDNNIPVSQRAAEWLKITNGGQRFSEGLTPAQQAAYMAEGTKAFTSGIAQASNEAHIFERQQFAAKQSELMDTFMQSKQYGDVRKVKDNAVLTGSITPQDGERIETNVRMNEQYDGVIKSMRNDPSGELYKTIKATGEAGGVIKDAPNLSPENLVKLGKVGESIHFQNIWNNSVDPMLKRIQANHIIDPKQLEQYPEFNSAPEEQKQMLRMRAAYNRTGDEARAYDAAGQGLVNTFPEDLDNATKELLDRKTWILGNVSDATASVLIDKLDDKFAEMVGNNGRLKPQSELVQYGSQRLAVARNGGVFGKWNDPADVKDNAAKAKANIEIMKQVEDVELILRNSGAKTRADVDRVVEEATASGIAKKNAGEIGNKKGWFDFLNSKKAEAIKPRAWMNDPQASTGSDQGKITKYGYEKPGDKDYDSNSARGIGAADNQLTPGESIALSPDLEKSTGAKIGDKVVVTLANGEKMVKRFDDRTSKRLKGRVDIYSPDGNQPLDGVRVAKVEKYTEDGQG